MPERKGRFRGLGHLRGHQGSSLIELLTVVAVILIIVSIAIPNFIRPKMRANEATGVQNARNVTTAEVVYSTTYGIGFCSSFAKLGPAAGGSILADASNAGLIDDVLAIGTRSGYKFSYAATDIDGDGKLGATSLRTRRTLFNSVTARRLPRAIPHSGNRWFDLLHFAAWAEVVRPAFAAKPLFEDGCQAHLLTSCYTWRL